MGDFDLFAENLKKQFYVDFLLRHQNLIKIQLYERFMGQKRRSLLHVCDLGLWKHARTRAMSDFGILDKMGSLYLAWCECWGSKSETNWASMEEVWGIFQNMLAYVSCILIILEVFQRRTCKKVLDLEQLFWKWEREMRDCGGTPFCSLKTWNIESSLRTYGWVSEQPKLGVSIWVWEKVVNLERKSWNPCEEWYTISTKILELAHVLNSSGFIKRIVKWHGMEFWIGTVLY